MAWNQPTKKDVAQQVGAGHSRLAWCCILVSVAGALAVVGFLALHRGPATRGGPGPAEPRDKPGLRDPRPAKAVPAPVRPPSARPSAPTNAVLLTKNVTPPTVLGCNYYECVSGGRPLFTKPIFTNSAENIIGGLLSARPGERFVPVELGEDFDNDFAASLEVPIEVTADDSPDNAIVKEAVSRAKKLIAESMSRGQKTTEVVMSMRDEMNKVADYRDLLQEDFDALKETGSADEIESYLKEANALLDEFGAARLDLPEDEVEEINARLSKGK